MPVQRPREDEVRLFDSAAKLRAWLAKHHDTADEVWIGYYKKGVPKASATYAEAVEEALCFGWIDGIGYTVNDEVHTNRFTPRRAGSSWSAVNIAKVAELKAAGRMHPAGLRAFEERDRRRDGANLLRGLPAELPADARDRLRADPAAWEYWQSRTPSYRRTAVRWIYSAKRPDTRERRLATLIEDCAAQRPIKPLSYGRERE